MDLLSILAARATAWVEVIDLNPSGAVPYPALVEGLVRRFGFQGFPQKIEDFDETKGVTFLQGMDGETVIERVVIYTHGIVLDTRESTDVSRKTLESALDWAAKELGLVYTPQSIKRWVYYSQIAFETNVHLSFVNPALNALANQITDRVKDLSGETLKYEPSFVAINHDPLLRQFGYGYFSIQKRAGVPFTDNQYFSDAPLPTDTHISLLLEFEKRILETLPARVGVAK